MVSEQSLKKMYDSGNPRLQRKALRQGFEPSGLEDEEEEPEPESLSDLTKNELKDRLREQDKKVSGTKDELIERLQE